MMMQEARIPSLKDKIVAEPSKEVVSEKKIGGSGRASANKENKKKDEKKK